MDTSPCEMLAWDSTFWGFPVARVRGNRLTTEQVAMIDQWCTEHRVACLYFLATLDDPETVRSAEDAAFRLVDTRIAAVLTADRFSLLVPAASGSQLTIRPAAASDLPALQSMAEVSFPTTRFYFDRHFPLDRCGEMYAHWIAESFRRETDVLLIAEQPMGLVGYLSIQHPPHASRAQIGLLNVAAEARRQGIAQDLVREGLAWCEQRNVHELVGISQGRNIAVQAFNTRVGFITESCQIWYHKWYEPFALLAT